MEELKNSSALDAALIAAAQYKRGTGSLPVFFFHQNGRAARSPLAAPPNKIPGYLLHSRICRMGRAAIVMTVALEMSMSSAAITGCSKPAAAIVMPSAL